MWLSLRYVSCSSLLVLCLNRELWEKTERCVWSFGLPFRKYSIPPTSHCRWYISPPFDFGLGHVSCFFNDMFENMTKAEAWNTLTWLGFPFCTSPFHHEWTQVAIDPRKMRDIWNRLDQICSLKPNLAQPNQYYTNPRQPAGTWQKQNTKQNKTKYVYHRTPLSLGYIT